jgi:hypothetical protein
VGGFRVAKWWISIHHTKHFRHSFRRGAWERVKLGLVFEKVARRDQRKEPGTFELLNDPSLLDYES